MKDQIIFQDKPYENIVCFAVLAIAISFCEYIYPLHPHPFLELDMPDVIIASMKPSNDHKAWIARRFGAAGKTAQSNFSLGTIGA